MRILLLLTYVKQLAACIAIILVTTENYAQPSSALSTNDSVILTDPPICGFYAKYVNSDGIAVRSARVVVDRALLVASGKIRMMLDRMPAARQNLIKRGAALHIIGKDQQTSDLPEYAHLKGVNYVDNGIATDIDKRTRGMGGLQASCGEENLLKLATDRYAGDSDICIHEFAHTIMNFGFDESMRQKIASRYKKAVADGLWKDAYAAANADEYWAELSMWYFGAHGEFLKNTRLPVSGKAGLGNYDSEGYKLLDSIYSGIIKPQVLNKIETEIVAKEAVSGISTVKAEFVLVNNKATPIKLYWINENGKAKFYAEVPAHKRLVQSTYFSHVWMFEDVNKMPLAYVRVNDPPCELAFKD